MATQLLIYESVVPLSAARHGDASVQVEADYGFSGKINSVPLMGIEFPLAASEYAIVFAGTSESVMPAVILGIRDSENLYLSKEGRWNAQYVPAFVRRYPFVFSNSADNQRLVLCVDEAFSGFNREGKGEKLFRHDGKPTAHVENVLRFLQEYQAQFARTRVFCDKLRELDLLEPMQARMESGGEKLALSGFMAVSRNKLKALSAEKMLELAKTDELELIYLHLQSMRNFSVLPTKLAAQQSVPAANGHDSEQPAAPPAETRERRRGKRDTAEERS